MSNVDTGQVAELTSCLTPVSETDRTSRRVGAGEREKVSDSWPVMSTRVAERSADLHALSTQTAAMHTTRATSFTGPSVVHVGRAKEPIIPPGQPRDVRTALQAKRWSNRRAGVRGSLAAVLGLRTVASKTAGGCVCAAILIAWIGQPALADSPEPEPQRPATASPCKHAYAVAAIGDSITDARSHGGRYLQILAERCPKSRFDNYGKGGQMVNQMRARFARDVLGEPTDPDNPKPRYGHVIVFGGVNDVGSDDTAGRTPDKIEADLRAMYEAARSRGMKVIAVTVAPWGGFKRLYSPKRGLETREVNRWIQQQLRLQRVDLVIDAWGMLSCGDADRLCPAFAQKDGLHWNAEGHRKIGEAMAARIFADCE